MSAERSRIAFSIVLSLLATQRLLELRLSRRNERALLRRGAREVGAEHFRWMRLLHATWFGAMLGEVFLFRRPFRPRLAAGAALFTLLGQFLRYSAIRTLGTRWTVRVLVLPGAPPIQDGIYRYLRHPNYLGVILEIGTVPLLHNAYLTSLFFSLTNALLLRTRIRVEESALAGAGDYRSRMAGLPRLLPRWRR